MELTITTPALLFPAISLLFLSYNGRFLAISSLIRNLHSEYKKNPDADIMGQLHNLSVRLKLIRWMQWLGLLAFVSSAGTMLLLYINQKFLAHALFGASQILLIASLCVSLSEIHISINALRILIKDIM
jgi:Protein of unknown function (DUF2721)